MDKVMLIRYDEKPPRQLTDKDGKLAPCFTDTEGFNVYILDSQTASTLATGNPDRYKYYRSPAIDIKKTNTNGSVVWEKLYSEYYKKESYEAKDPENGETIYKYRYVWVTDTEDKYVQEPSEEFITGKKKAFDASKEINLLTGENKELKSALEGMKKMIDDLKGTISGLRDEIEGIKDKKEVAFTKPEEKNKVGRPKGS